MTTKTLSDVAPTPIPKPNAKPNPNPKPSPKPRAPRRGVRESVRSARKKLGESSVLAFGKAYLPGHFQSEPSSMHTEIEAALLRATERRGVKLAIAAPRGHAKSTLISLAYVLWSLCYRHEQFIVLISDTADQAIGMLGHIRHELSSNTRLKEDFPEVCEPSGPPGSWRKEEITLRSGARITALGAEQKIRGRRHGASRPTLIILDDAENEELAKSPEQRERRWSWLTGTALNAGCSTTNVVAAGTLLHPDSLLARLVGLAKPDPGAGTPSYGVGWEQRVYKAVTSWSGRSDLWDTWEAIQRGDETHDGMSGTDAAHGFYEANKAAMLEGAGVIWPEREDYERLMIGRLEGGRRAFDAEKQNEPSSPERCVFREEDLHFWDDERSPIQSVQQLMASLNGRYYVFGALDPSLGKAGKNADDSAFVTILQEYGTKQLYVIDADIRRRRPHEIIAAVVQYCRLRKYIRICVESTQYQEFLRLEIERGLRDAQLTVPVKAIVQTTDKLGRIQRLQPLMASGKLKFSRRHAQLIDQLLRFPNAHHDDGPDALEMAVRASEMSVARAVPSAPGAW